MSLYNLTRSKHARKVFICKKCKVPININHALTHFDGHSGQDSTGKIRYCGHCDQTFFMQNDESRELMYRRHIYECISGRSCSGKLVVAIQNRVKTANLLNPFLINVQRADNVNQKRSVVSTPLAVDNSSPSASMDVNPAVLQHTQPESMLSPLLETPLVEGEDEGIPVLSKKAQKQYLETIDTLNVENYWKERQNNDMIRRSLELALGKFAHPFKYQQHAEKSVEKPWRHEQYALCDDEIVDHRSFFRRLVAIVRKKLRQHTTKMPVFCCRLTGVELKIGVDLLRHMREHSGSKEVRVCCKCDGRFLFLNDCEENLYLYHLLRCVLNLRPEMDDDVRLFIDICRKGYLIDPSCPNMFDEAAFLRGDRENALKGYRLFLANNPRFDEMFIDDKKAMHRVLQMFPMLHEMDNPLLEMQIRDTLRFYDERFEAMLEYEFRCRDTSSQRSWYDADEDFNCKKCSKDKRAIGEGTFDRYMDTLGPSRMGAYRKAFLSNEHFLSRFPPEWLIDTKRDDYRERLPVEMGFHFWLVLIAQKLPYKHFSLFNDGEKKSQPIFMHIFIYMKYAREILRELLSDEFLYYILPYTCLCRDSSVVIDHDAIGDGGDNDNVGDVDNVHRHVIVVFRNSFAFSTFTERTRIIKLDRQRVREQNNFRGAMATMKRRKLITNEMSEHENAKQKKNQIKTKYMIPILNHAHYYHAIRYVSRDKIALNAKRRQINDDEGRDVIQSEVGSVHDKTTNKRKYKMENGEDMFHQQRMDRSCDGHDDEANSTASSEKKRTLMSLDHTRFSRHFYFSIPMVYHAKPCLFLLYPHGLSDWLAESFTVKHLLYRLLRCVRQKAFWDQERIRVDYVVSLSDIVPYLNNYIGGHGFPLKVTLQDDNASYPYEQPAEIECAKAGVFIVSNRISFHLVRYFDDLRDVEVRLLPRLTREIKWMDSLSRQLIRFNLAMYKNFQVASEKIFWLNIRSSCLSDQLKRVMHELMCALEQLSKTKTENDVLCKNVQNLQDNVAKLTCSNNDKDAEIIKLRQQIVCLRSALQRLQRV